jgi:putative effector of murein hydrolase
MTACMQMKRKQILTRAGLLALVVVLVLAPLRPAHAYVDPNSVGPLYQFLFPALIAIASAFAALRRQLARLWNRVVDTVVAAVRGERQPPRAQ